MSEQTQHFYEFGRFRLITSDRVLLRDHEVVQLTPKVFDILQALVESNGQVISKDGLMRRVWPDTFVEEGNLTQNISLLRKALGEGANGHQYIETVARRGYRFVAPVRDASADGTDHSTSATPNGGSSTAPTDIGQTDSFKPEIGHGFLHNLTKSARRRGLALGAFLLLILGGAGVIYFAGGSRAVNGNSTVIESIAILPFVNEASDSEVE